MKRLPVLAAILIAACSSAPQGPKANITPPDLDFEQAFGPGEVGFPDGPIDVKYVVRVTNRAAIPITLRRLLLRTVNPPGGPYTLTPPLEHTMNIEIPANGEKSVEVWAHARSYGVTTRDREPVTIKGTAYFETAQGYYNQILNIEIPQ